MLHNPDNLKWGLRVHKLMGLSLPVNPDIRAAAARKQQVFIQHLLNNFD